MRNVIVASLEINDLLFIIDSRQFWQKSTYHRLHEIQLLSWQTKKCLPKGLREMNRRAPLRSICQRAKL